MQHKRLVPLYLAIGLSLTACNPVTPPVSQPLPSANPSTNPSSSPSAAPGESPSPMPSELPGSETCQDTSPDSRFTRDSEGWTIVGDAQDGNVEPEYHDAGGNPGGYVSADDDVTGGVWYWSAPAAYLGNQSAAYGQVLSFELRQSGLNAQFESDDVVLEGGDITLVYTLPAHPELEWTAYRLSLSEGMGWKVGSRDGADATAAEIQAALGDVTRLWIRGEFIEGADTGSLDNVRLGHDNACASAAVISRFTTDTEDWRVSGDAQDGSAEPVYQAAGGNPGGHLTATDDVTGGVWYWDAPERYLGNKASSFGKTLSFELKQSGLNSQFESDDVILAGAGQTLALKLPEHPGTEWSAYSVKLEASAGWKLGGVSGEAASNADIQAVLADLTRLWIRGEYIEGPDTGGLDNVILER